MKAFASLLGLAALASACADPYEGAAPFLAEKALVERELDGLRDSAARLYRGESLFPLSDVVISIDEGFVQGLIAASLPIDLAAAPYRVMLTSAEVGFNGAPTVRLRGTITREGIVTVDADVNLIGALSDMEIDAATSTLRAAITADHLEITRAEGLETFLSGSSLDDVARLVRREVALQLPTVELPVRVQQDIEIPAVSDGPVRLAGGRLPVKASVSRVFALDHRLWIGLHIELGQVVKGKP